MRNDWKNEKFYIQKDGDNKSQDAMTASLGWMIIKRIMEINDSWKQGHTIQTWIKRENVNVKSEIR